MNDPQYDLACVNGTPSVYDESCVFHPDRSIACTFEIKGGIVGLCHQCRRLIAPLVEANSRTGVLSRDLGAIRHVAERIKEDGAHTVTGCPRFCRAMCQYKREVLDLQADGIIP